MSKASLKGLSSIADAASQANIHLIKATPRVGKIGASRLLGAAEAKAIQEAVKELVAELRTHYEALGQVLADPETVAWQTAEIADEESQLAAAITSTGDSKKKDRPYQVVVIAAGEAMAEFFPCSVIGLGHIAFHGVQTGLLRPMAGNDKQFFINLPGGSDGRWKKYVSDVPGTAKLMGQYLAMADEVSQSIRTERHRRAQELRLGTANLLEVIEAGVGETVCYVPGGQKDGRSFPEAYFRVQIEGGQITAIEATGSGFIESLIGISIPLVSLRESRFKYQTLRGKTDEDVRLMAAFRRFINDAIAIAMKQVGSNSESATPVSSPARTEPAAESEAESSAS